MIKTKYLTFSKRIIILMLLVVSGFLILILNGRQALGRELILIPPVQSEPSFYIGEDGMRLCECGCGREVAKEGNRFIHSHNRRGEYYINDLTGKKFGKWIVLKYVGGERHRWLCVCECGLIKPVRGYDLRHGLANGCQFCSYKKENRKTRVKKVKKICEFCNKEFYIFPNRKYEACFCSKSCSSKGTSKSGSKNSKWKGGKIERVCKACGKPFYVYSYSNGKYCSSNCYPHDSFKGRNHTGKTKKRMSESHIQYMKNNKDKFKETSIEIAIEDKLKKAELNYQKQFHIKEVGIVDFFLPDYKIIIECDGDYFHNLPGAQQKDSNRDFMATFGDRYKVVRFWEHEINESSEKCIKRLFKIIKKRKKVV